MSIKIDLLIIDPQNDFCVDKETVDITDPKDPTRTITVNTGRGGSLFVKGADEDMKRVSKFIDRVGGKLNDLHVTMDTHHIFSVFHPTYWKNTAGKNPNPFTIIDVKSVENGDWTPTIPHLFKRSVDYVKALEKSARYPLCIWPEHCLIGSWGHNIFPELYESISRFEKTTGIMCDYVTKGSNPFVEAYSVVKAEIPDPSDPNTQINTGFIQSLTSADVVLLAGEASSHCVFNSLKDIVNGFGDPDQTKKIKFMEDCSSPVPGFEKLHTELLDYCKTNSIEVIKSVDYLK
jgi:nicotinamidase-related amidase